MRRQMVTTMYNTDINWQLLADPRKIVISSVSARTLKCQAEGNIEGHGKIISLLFSTKLRYTPVSSCYYNTV